MKLHWHDVEELAAAALGLGDDADSDVIEGGLIDKFDVSFEQFQAVAEALVDFTLPAQAALSGEFFKGFVRDKSFIVKVPHNAYSIP